MSKETIDEGAEGKKIQWELFAASFELQTAQKRESQSKQRPYSNADQATHAALFLLHVLYAMEEWTYLA